MGTGTTWTITTGISCSEMLSGTLAPSKYVCVFKVRFSRQRRTNMASMWNLKEKWYKWTYLKNRNRVTDVENSLDLWSPGSKGRRDKLGPRRERILVFTIPSFWSYLCVWQGKGQHWSMCIILMQDRFVQDIFSFFRNYVDSLHWKCLGCSIWGLRVL